MLRRVLIFGSVAVLVCAVVMVVLAARTPEGLVSALAIWGFVLTGVGVVLGVVGLRAAKPAGNSGSGMQVVKAERGDAFGVQNGTMNVNKPSKPEAKRRDNQ
ncbi:hypothetical protein SAMN04487914_1232 [Arthrobacter sp. ok909]|nr:hypothetical protein SAMN04487914_1232 [Arthrobacter sp. ok909]